MPYKNIEEETAYKISSTGKGLEPCLCTIYVWSQYGNTPITKRGGSYCDELLKVEVELTSHCEAQALADKYLRETKHASRSSFTLTGYWNQNLNSGFGKWE